MNNYKGLKIRSIETFGWKNALYGMRLPKNSEHMLDSVIGFNEVILGANDFSLLLRLSKAGVAHRKVLRMIHVQASVTMPISWWIQYDTYKVATTANSRSRMHKFGERPLTKEDFFLESLTFDNSRESFEKTLRLINSYIELYKYEKENYLKQAYWSNALNLLPQTYLQERMIDLNYETLLAILELRYNEKLLTEWRFFCDSFLYECPYLFTIWQYTIGKDTNLDVNKLLEYFMEKTANE